jgi:hypothetical protein
VQADTGAAAILVDELHASGLGRGETSVTVRAQLDDRRERLPALLLVASEPSLVDSHNRKSLDKREKIGFVLLKR